MNVTAASAVDASRPAASSPGGDQAASGRASVTTACGGKEAARMISQGVQSLGMIIALLTSEGSFGTISAHTGN